VIEDNKGMKYILYIIVVLFIVGCGSDTSSSRTLFGSVVDGYIQGAKVCLDLNENTTCDDGEPTTTTDSNGSYSLIIPPGVNATFKPILAIGGFDTATNTLYSGEMKAIVSSSDSIIINPLTDMVATKFMDTNATDAYTLQSIKGSVATTLNIDAADLEANPMSNRVVFQKVQQLENAKVLLETALFKQLPSWGTPSYDNGKRKQLREKIKLGLLSSNAFRQNSFDTLLDSLEKSADVNISTNEKQLIHNQIIAINSGIENVSTTTIDNANLPLLQRGVKKVLDAAITAFDTNSSNATLVSMPTLEALMVNGEQNASECVDMITFAKNPTSGTCERFANPCVAPKGWKLCSMGGFYYKTNGVEYQNRIIYLNRNRLSIGDIEAAFCSTTFEDNGTVSTTCKDDSDLKDVVLNYKPNNLMVLDFVLPIEAMQDMDVMTKQKIAPTIAYADNNLLLFDSMGDTTFATFNTFQGMGTKSILHDSGVEFGTILTDVRWEGSNEQPLNTQMTMNTDYGSPTATVSLIDLNGNAYKPSTSGPATLVFTYESMKK